METRWSKLRAYLMGVIIDITDNDPTIAAAEFASSRLGNRSRLRIFNVRSGFNRGWMVSSESSSYSERRPNIMTSVLPEYHQHDNGPCTDRIQVIQLRHPDLSARTAPSCPVPSTQSLHSFLCPCFRCINETSLASLVVLPLSLLCQVTRLGWVVAHARVTYVICE